MMNNHQPSTEETMKKVLLYFERKNPCCEGKYESHEELLNRNAVIGTAYFVDEITGNEWGDDWNDAPACGNSGPPYPERCSGLEIVEIALGKSFPSSPINDQ